MPCGIKGGAGDNSGAPAGGGVAGGCKGVEVATLDAGAVLDDPEEALSPRKVGKGGGGGSGGSESSFTGFNRRKQNEPRKNTTKNNGETNEIGSFHLRDLKTGGWGFRGGGVPAN